MTIQLFINYNPVAGATINTYRNNGNWHDNDLPGSCLTLPARMKRPAVYA